MTNVYLPKLTSLNGQSIEKLQYDLPPMPTCVVPSLFPLNIPPMVSPKKMKLRKYQRSSSPASDTSSKTSAISRTYKQHNSFKHIQNFVRDIKLTGKRNCKYIKEIHYAICSLLSSEIENEKRYQDLQTTEHRTKSKRSRNEKIMHKMSWLRE